MTTTIHLRVDEKTKEKYYQEFYKARSEDTKINHDKFMLGLISYVKSKKCNVNKEVHREKL